MEDKISYLLTVLKSRLCASGKNKVKDEDGNVTFVDCDIYENEDLIRFINLSISQVKLLCDLDDDDVFDSDRYDSLVVQGAAISALAGKMLQEKGREFTMIDAGLSFTPPNVSDILLRQWEVELSDYREKIRFLVVR